MTTATNEDFKFPFPQAGVKRPWHFFVNGERVESRYQYVFMGWDLNGVAYYEKVEGTK